MTKEQHRERIDRIVSARCAAGYDYAATKSEALLNELASVLWLSGGSQDTPRR